MTNNELEQKKERIAKLKEELAREEAELKECTREEEAEKKYNHVMFALNNGFDVVSIGPATRVTKEIPLLGGKWYPEEFTATMRYTGSHEERASRLPSTEEFIKELCWPTDNKWVCRVGDVEMQCTRVITDDPSGIPSVTVHVTVTRKVGDVSITAKASATTPRVAGGTTAETVPMAAALKAVRNVHVR